VGEGVSEIALPLFSREEYAKQQRVSLEPYDFDSYDEWFEKVNETKKFLESNGVKVVFVGVVVSELEEWLKKKGLKNISKNVAFFVADRLGLERIKKK
jgi:hypothetical protein